MTIIDYTRQCSMPGHAARDSGPGECNLATTVLRYHPEMHSRVRFTSDVAMNLFTGLVVRAGYVYCCVVSPNVARNRLPNPVLFKNLFIFYCSFRFSTKKWIVTSVTHGPKGGLLPFTRLLAGITILNRD